MKKIILILFMAMISSFSYYGVVNEKGEKIQYNQDLEQQGETKEYEFTLEEVAEAMNKPKENEEIEQEMQKQEVKENNNQMQKTKEKVKLNNGQDSKTEKAKQTTEKKDTTTVNSKNTNTTVTTQTKTNETRYVKNEQMIQKIKQIIQNNETQDMKNYGYTVVVDSSIKDQTNQFTFTESRVINNIKYSFGTIRIYAEDYYSNGQLIMTECYIL